MTPELDPATLVCLCGLASLLTGIGGMLACRWTLRRGGTTRPICLAVFAVQAVTPWCIWLALRPAPAVLPAKVLIASRVTTFTVGQGAFLPQSPSVRVTFAIASAVVAIGGVAALGAFATGLWQAHRLRRECRPADDRLMELVERAARRLGITRRVRLLVGPDRRLASPATWGLLYPQLYLPESMSQWSDEMLEGAIRHELVHVRRGDWTVCALARSIAALYWFNPFDRWLYRELHRATELECDRETIASGIAPTAYAESLLAAARIGLARLRSVSTLVSGAPIEHRVAAVLRPSQVRRSPPFAAALFIALLSANVALAGAAQRAIFQSSPAARTQAWLAEQIGHRHPGVRVRVWIPGDGG